MNWKRMTWVIPVVLFALAAVGCKEGLLGQGGSNQPPDQAIALATAASQRQDAQGTAIARRQDITDASVDTLRRDNQAVLGSLNQISNTLALRAQQPITPSGVITPTSPVTPSIVTAPPPVAPQAPITVVVVIPGLQPGAIPGTQPSAAPVTRPATGPAPAPAPAAAPPTGGQSSASICDADKVSTINEVLGAGQQRIEVGGGGVQHVDYYPHPGIKAVSYIVPKKEPDVWYGHGSIWEWKANCSDFDWVKDATDYARGRMDNGHSGVVIDLRGGTPKVVANVGNMSDADIQALLSVHDSSKKSKGATGPQPAPSSVPSGASTGASAASAACDGVRSNPDREPKLGVPFQFNPTGSWVVFPEGWTNERGQDQKGFRLILSPNDNPSLLIGGAYWTFAANCEQQARAAFNKDQTKPEQKLADLQARGLVR